MYRQQNTFASNFSSGYKKKAVTCLDGVKIDLAKLQQVPLNKEETPDLGGEKRNLLHMKPNFQFLSFISS